MQTSIAKTVLLLLCSTALLLSGCAGAGAKKGAGKSVQKGAPAVQAAKRDISYLTFSLPEQVKWERNPDEALANAGVAEWTMAGYSPADSPARVMYQKLEPAQAATTLRNQMLEPLKTCQDSQNNPKTHLLSLCESALDAHMSDNAHQALPQARYDASLAHWRRYSDVA